MSEFKYVCMVEALILLISMIMLVTFRIDVFTWTSEETWPVFTTCAILLLATAYCMLLPCVILYTKELSREFSEILMTCVTTSRSLLLIVGTVMLHLGLHVIVIEKTNRHLFLCQLLATECNVSNEQIWNATHTVLYGAFIIPLTIFVIGLISHVSFCFQLDAKHAISTINMNLVYLILAQIFLTLEYNSDTACENGCTSTVFVSQPKTAILTFFPVSMASAVLFVVDASSIIMFHHSNTEISNLQFRCISSVFVRVLQLVFQILLCKFVSIPIPVLTIYVHIALYTCCIIFDVINMFYSTHNIDIQTDSSVKIIVPASSQQPSQAFGLDQKKILRLGLNSKRLWSNAELALKSQNPNLQNKKTA